MGGQCAASASQSLPPERRELGLVLQDHALWPHMSLQANVAFALEMRGLPRAQIHERVQQTLGLVGLQGMGERLPGSLSGGQQQRAALACAVVERPRLVLLDEPLSGLDGNLRKRLCEEIPRLLRSLGCTAVYATQDRRSEEHTSELQSPCNLVCRLLLEKKTNIIANVSSTYSI